MLKKKISIVVILCIVIISSVTALAAVNVNESASGYAYRNYDLDKTSTNAKIRAYGTMGATPRARTYLYNLASTIQYCTAGVKEYYQTTSGTLMDSSYYAKPVDPNSYVTTDITRDYADMNLLYYHYGSRYNSSSAAGANSYSLAVTFVYKVFQY